ncbi:PRC-barrel domain-containing protein [Leptolyngbya sp. AN02str]|uniref:PRC-barrel domain-containing protein n=1 Tax=Leptolyngbya sp. AN02str TaxID=3423363 RepID=UPI003D31EA24
MTNSPNSPQSSIVRQSDLIGRRVLNRNTAEELGKVDGFWVDVKQHQILGLVCESGLLGLKRQSFNWSQIESIGAQAVVVSVLDGVEVHKPETAETVLGHEVWTEGGDRIGQVQDFCLELETGDVVGYLFINDNWGGLAKGTYLLPTQTIVSMGSRRLMVHQSAVENVGLFSGNIRQQTQAFLVADLERTKQDMSWLLQGTQAIANRIFDKTQQLVEQSKEKLAEASQQITSSQGQEQPSETPTDAPTMRVIQESIDLNSGASASPAVEVEAVIDPDLDPDISKSSQP